MPGWKTHKLQSRLPGEISITSDDRYHQIDRYHLPSDRYYQKVERN